MTRHKLHAALGVPLILASLAGPPALAQAAPADRDDAALAFAQCMRDNGYAEFPDPTPEGGIRFQITPDSAPRFRQASEACRHLAPEGMRGEEPTPDEVEALITLAQCVRDNGVSEFPDPTADGRFELQGLGIGPGDARLDAAMTTCSGQGGFPQGMRIMIGG